MQLLCYNQIEGPRYRLKSTERILREVEEAVTVGGARSIEFVDSTFNIPLDHAVRICKALAERKFSAGFSTMGINPGAVTESFSTCFERLTSPRFPSRRKRLHLSC